MRWYAPLRTYLDSIVLERSWASKVRCVLLPVGAGVNGAGYRENLANYALAKHVLGRAKPDPGKPWRGIRTNNPPERQ